jgi:hypothetical protein
MITLQHFQGAAVVQSAPLLKLWPGLRSRFGGVGSVGDQTMVSDDERGFNSVSKG